MQKPSKGISWRISDIYRREAKTMNRRAGGDGLCKREPQWWSAAGTCKKPRGSTARGFAEAMESPSLTEGRMSKKPKSSQHQLVERILVAGIRLLSLRLRRLFRDASQVKAWLVLLALVFSVCSLTKTSFWRAQKEKTRCFAPGFYFVDKVIEISNLDLMKGLREVVDFIDNSE